ncbi:hypothetical protein [Streptomyces hawaiiensis]|uniref:hypothetical protein n=1 Tax=Streptomyces hawaiiensis TaxID=67305 RepID=UPI001585EAD0|nr:hypothetical protein [Streptomyces hawaiiensis]
MVREAVAELILTPITWDTLRADPLEQWSVELRRAVRAGPPEFAVNARGDAPIS